MTQPLKKYQPSELPKEIIDDCGKTARKIASTKRGQELSNVLTMILLDNAVLLAEVNTHRATLGYELLPVHKNGG